MHISYWPPSWPFQQSLNEDLPTLCVQRVAWPTGQHSRTFAHINRGKSHWIELMQPAVDSYYEFLSRNGVSHPCCELCANNHCWPHCTSKKHFDRVYALARNCPLDWEQSRIGFIQQFQVADCIVRFNHLDGSIDALSVHSSIPDPLDPLEQPPPPSHPPPTGSSAPLGPLEQPPPPSYPPPTGSSEEPLAVPVSPASPLLEDGLRRATGAAPLPAHTTTGSRQTTPSPSTQFAPPQRAVLWHLRIAVDDDNSRLERAI